MEKIKVLLAEDHTIVREGIKSLLASQGNISIVGEASDGREAVEMARRLLPDLVIMDISMPLLNGLEATRQIREKLPQCKILVLTVHDNREYVHQILKAGASGYLVKKTAASTLFEAIQAVYQGEAFFSPSISKILMEDFIEKRGEDEEPLSPREREILQLVAEGRSNKEISEILCLSVKTIESHKENIKRKLGIQDHAGMIKYAIRKGLVTP